VSQVVYLFSNELLDRVGCASRRRNSGWGEAKHLKSARVSKR